ncbi:MAG: hypothetical protein EZS28_010536 [Streblomastix strix]|uniref:Uncharacterized protein n=1 Tax=Streblomastix strix TaxID=222440 RepID=A0A5J4WG79_9EUKA|nr:MAG: hypothetical protein EZS28_010536 [Streblomastix strix]
MCSTADHSPTTSAMNQPQKPVLPTAAQISVHSQELQPEGMVVFHDMKSSSDSELLIYKPIHEEDYDPRISIGRRAMIYSSLIILEACNYLNLNKQKKHKRKANKQRQLRRGWGRNINRTRDSNRKFQ